MSNRVTSPHAARHTGRPPLPPERVRRNRVVTMVTDSEFQQLQSRAEEGNKSVSSFVHSILRQLLADKARVNEGEKP